MSATETGRLAEDVAASFLTGRGYEILSRNWRTRWCEIDIVAAKNEIIYFFEVKYRARANWGSGLEYITARKLQQMQFAAQFWLARFGRDEDCRLAAIELTGKPPRIERVINCQ